MDVLTYLSEVKTWKYILPPITETVYDSKS